MDAEHEYEKYASHAYEIHVRDEHIAALRTQNAALLAVVKEALQNCSIDNHAGADDFMCHFCNKARVVLAAAKGE